MTLSIQTESADDMIARIEREATYGPADPMADFAPDESEGSHPTPIPLDMPDVPEMPRDVLPGWLGSYAAEVANAAEVSPAFAIMHAVAAMAVAAQGKFSVSPERGYFEPVNIYCASALPSGNRKSFSQGAFFGPHRQWAKAKAAEAAVAIKKATSRRQVIETQLKAAKATAAQITEKAEFEKAMTLVDELEASLPEIPVMPELITGDVTPEHLGTLLSQQNERFSIVSAEGGIFDVIAGRYSNGLPNLDLVLQAHSGDPVDVHRGSRPSVRLHHPCLTICVAPQPSVLARLGNNVGFRDRGFLARFLFVCPRSNLGERTLQPVPIRDHIANDYSEFIRGLLDLPPRMVDDRPVPYVLTFSADAYAAWKAYQREVETMMKRGGKLDGMTDVGGKLPGQVARVAGLLHIAAHASMIEGYLTIGVESIRNAIRLVRVCLEHALHVYAVMGVDDSLEIARRLWEVAVKLNAPAVSARELWHPNRGKFPKMADADKGFDMLVERGWLIEQTDERRGRGRPSRKFLVNPKALINGHFGH